MSKRLEPKIRFMLTATAFAAAIVLFGFGILHYALPAIFQESGDIEQTKTNLAALEEKKAVLLSEEEKIKSLSARLDAIEAAIVPVSDPVAFFGTLERMAAYERLSLEINPAPAGQNELALTVSLTGAMKQEIDFVKNIAVLPFIVTVSDIAFSRTVSAAPAQTSSSKKPVTPVLGETTLIMTLFAASRP